VLAIYIVKPQRRRQQVGLFQQAGTQEAAWPL
jgi:hypothetical protein